MRNHTINTLEFCSGMGGLGLGIKKVLGERMRVIGHCELEGFAQANLISKMEKGLLDEAPIWTNLLTFPYAKFRGLVDLAIAGIPCQPHSTAGKRKGGSDERFLFDDWLTGLEQIRPTTILIENVEGLLSSKMPDGSLCIEWTLQRLEGMGYESAFCLCSASEVGLPHQRKRVFIMAYDKSQRVEGYWQGWLQESYAYARKTLSLCGGEASHASPARPNQPQFWWEPPRVLGNTKHDGSSGTQVSRNNDQASYGDSEGEEIPFQSEGASGSVDPENISINKFGEIQYQFGFDEAGLPSRPEAQSSVGGDLDGSADWMDYARLCKTYHNRTEELRLLGNGVCPPQAERAFLVLLSELGQKVNI